MSLIFLLLSIAILGKFVWDVFRIKGKEFEFPFLIGIVYIGWLLPQAIAMIGGDYFPDFAVTRFMIGMFLSLIAIWAGWDWLKVYPFFKKDIGFTNQQLKWICLGYSLAGAYFFYKLGQWMDETEFTTGIMSGTGTIYVFFSQLMTIGMILALIQFFRTKHKVFLCVSCIGLFFYAERIIVQGRRAAMAELFVIVGYLLFRYKKIALSRTFLLLIVFVGFLIINSIGEYRSQMIVEGNARGVWEIPYWENFKNTFRSAGLYEIKQTEIKNGIVYMDCFADMERYGWGKEIWNSIVWQYIPAQILGAEFKKSLMFVSLREECGWVRHSGTTVTGVAWSFMEFGYFGLLVFFLISYVMKLFFIGHILTINELLYLLLITSAMHSISHSPMNFILKLMTTCMFAFPLVIYRRRHGD